MALTGAEDGAEARVRRNYEAAVPSWYPTRDEVQLLLPLLVSAAADGPSAPETTRWLSQNRAKEMRALGMNTVTINRDAENAAAGKLYEALGFEITGLTSGFGRPLLTGRPSA
jgi:hypothetical protein